MCDVEKEPKVAVSVEMKVNLGGYESVGGSAVLSGLKAGATVSEINLLLETGELAFDLIRERLKEKLYDVKQERVSARNGK